MTIPPFKNRLQKIVQKIDKLPLPKAVRRRLLSLAMGKVVKLVGTCGVRFQVLNSQTCEVELANKVAVQNHIGQIHAAAMILLAETATGLVFGMNVQDHCIPLVKSMNVQFKKRSTGAMRAAASLSSEQINLIRSTVKGEVIVPVHVYDEVNIEPIVVEVCWAWTAKK